jgi:hypothetical protein
MSMTSLSDRQWMMPEEPSQPMRISGDEPAETRAGDRDGLQPMTFHFERREHRRFDVGSSDISIERWDGRRDTKLVFGKLLDLSAGGVRLRTRQAGIRPDQQIRVRLDLPGTGGICPFVEVTGGEARPKTEWVGWLAVSRVRASGDAFEVAGRLVDMEEMDRGMLGLYLSTQPLAA